MKRSNPHLVSQIQTLHYIIQDIPISEADTTKVMKVKKKLKTKIKKHNNKILYRKINKKKLKIKYSLSQ